MKKPSPSEVVERARNAFRNGRTKSIEFREKQLRSLLKMYQENTDAIIEALAKDLHKSKHESIVSEVSMLISDVENVLDNFREWVKPEKRAKSLVNIMDQALLYNDPYGVVLIMGAWNYPFQVTLLPLASAIAAGNCVVLKPSELAEQSAELIEKLITKYLDNECYQVVLGSIETTTHLLQQRFDYIFFTGSTAVGKIVHAAANKHLTPTTLELGGKSPVYIDKSADIEVAARRILWGKCMNAGQTCVAPDYILCTEEVQGKFLKTAKKVLEDFYGDDVKKSPDYCRIINDNHFGRLTKLLDNVNIALGGKSDPAERYIEPTIVIDVKPEDAIMEGEIFGPILPIITINSIHDALKLINNREKPLAMYIFSNNQTHTDLLLNNTSSGGVTVNDTIMHLAVESLPFGGVGGSGMGAYHGKSTFDTFVHKKSTLVKDLSKLGEKLGGVRYPPYSEKKLNTLLSLLKRRKGIPLRFCSQLFMFALGIAAAFAFKMFQDQYQKRIQ